MKTIYLFAKIRAHKLVEKRASEAKAKKPGEIHVATLRNQPDDYWKRICVIGAKDVLYDAPINQ